MARKQNRSDKPEQPKSKSLKVSKMTLGDLTPGPASVMGGALPRSHTQKDSRCVECL